MNICCFPLRALERLAGLSSGLRCGAPLRALRACVFTRMVSVLVMRGNEHHRNVTEYRLIIELKRKARHGKQIIENQRA